MALRARHPHNRCCARFRDVRWSVACPDVVIAAVTKPAVPGKPTLMKAYKDVLILRLPPADGAKLTVEYAESPAYLYYSWVATPDDAVRDSTATITGLSPNRSYVTKVVATNVIGSTPSAVSDVFTTLTPQADAELRLAEAASKIAELEDRSVKVTTEKAQVESVAASKDSTVQELNARIVELEGTLHETRKELAASRTSGDTHRNEIKT